MGLFGIYTKKDFENRTKEFKESLDNMYRAASQMEGCGRLVTMLIMAFDSYNEYPKGNQIKRSDVKAIDGRIERLIIVLKEDLADKNVTKFTWHAKILYRTVKNSRRFGKEKYNERYLKLEEEIVMLMGEIHKAQLQKRQLEYKKQEFLKEARKLDSSKDQKHQSMVFMYSDLEAKEKIVLERLQELQKVRKEKESIAYEMCGSALAEMLACESVEHLIDSEASYSCDEIAEMKHSEEAREINQGYCPGLSAAKKTEKSGTENESIFENVLENN